MPSLPDLTEQFSIFFYFLIEEEEDTNARITRIIERELQDCTLIGPSAGAELHRMVYG